jgi:hypothetical protein
MRFGKREIDGNSLLLDGSHKSENIADSCINIDEHGGFGNYVQKWVTEYL